MKIKFGWLEALGLILITLKLAEVGVVAQWSWWLVLAPFWIEIALVVGILVGALVLGSAVELNGKVVRRRKK